MTNYDNRIEMLTVCIKTVFEYTVRVFSVKSYNLLAMEYKKPKVLVKSRLQLADCSRKGPCGRLSCASKPSGRH